MAIPSFGAFEPDIVLIRTPADDEIEIFANGNTGPIAPGDQRKALVVSDMKHAGEANSSYSSEVALCAVLLANWLRLNHLEGSFFVADHLRLWTRAKEVSDLDVLVTANPGPGITERLQTFLNDLERVDFQTFFQAVSYFFKLDLPRVLALINWTDSIGSRFEVLGVRFSGPSKLAAGRRSSSPGCHWQPLLLRRQRIQSI